MSNTNVMIVGVGGQGTLLASRVLGSTVIDAGYDVKVSEVHGMSQRGGSVVTYVKYGKKVYSPIIDLGGADIILAFELLEAYRALPYLKKGGKIIVNTQKMSPMPVITGAASYPQNILEKLREKAQVIDVDALSLAKAAGTQKCLNIVLMGVMAKNTDIPYAMWEKSLYECVPEKYLPVNLVAFKSGYEL